MAKYINTPEGLATVIGAGILTMSTNANVMTTGGYFTSHAGLVIALSAGVFAGARVVGAGAGKIGLVIVAALFAGEAFNLSATAERIVIERENGAAPLKDALIKHNAALEKLEALQGSEPSSARLIQAKADKQAADEAVTKEASDGCKSECRRKQGLADKAQTELVSALAEAEEMHLSEIEAAKADVEANPLPASATPLADRIGLPAWALDLIMAGLLSVGANGLAGTLIAFGAHRQETTAATISKPEIVSDNSGTDFDPVSMFEAAKLKGMVSGEFPDNPTPPKPRKRRKPDQFPENVIQFREHPVVSALRSNGGAVSSNQELADLMGVSKGEASKRWQEIEDQLTLTRDGNFLRIALKA